jgi:hypothetical protein
VDLPYNEILFITDLENIISHDNIKFWGEGADMITAEYEANGIDGELDFPYRYSCDGTTYTTLFSGILNCYFYDITNKWRGINKNRTFGLSPVSKE